MKDGRKRLRAHWPPRRIQTIQVELDELQYRRIYEDAIRNERSLADEIRSRI